jgi:hypothetical protein
MTNYLIKVLTKYASKTHKAETGSHYFWIDGLKVRVSDHATSKPGDDDLIIYSLQRGYLCIPCNVPFQKVVPCNNVRQVIGTITGVSFAKTLYIPPISEQTSYDKMSFVSKLNALCHSLPETVKKRLLHNTSIEVQELLLKYLSRLKSAADRQLFAEHISWMKNCSAMVAELKYKLSD